MMREIPNKKTIEKFENQDNTIKIEKNSKKEFTSL